MGNQIVSGKIEQGLCIADLFMVWGLGLGSKCSGRYTDVDDIDDAVVVDVTVRVPSRRSGGCESEIIEEHCYINDGD